MCTNEGSIGLWLHVDHELRGNVNVYAKFQLSGDVVFATRCSCFKTDMSSDSFLNLIKQKVIP